MNWRSGHAGASSGLPRPVVVGLHSPRQEEEKRVRQRPNSPLTRMPVDHGDVRQARRPKTGHVAMNCGGNLAALYRIERGDG